MLWACGMGERRGVRTGPAGPLGQKGRREVFLLFIFYSFISKHFQIILKAI